MMAGPLIMADDTEEKKNKSAIFDKFLMFYLE